MRAGVQPVGKNRGRSHLQASQPIVAIEEGGHRSSQAAGSLNLVPEFEGLQDFRAEVRPAREQVGWRGGDEQLSIDSRRSPDRPRSGRPQGLGRDRRPSHVNARLILEPRVLVVLDLGTQRQMKPVFL